MPQTRSAAKKAEEAAKGEEAKAEKMEEDTAKQDESEKMDVSEVIPYTNPVPSTSRMAYTDPVPSTSDVAYIYPVPSTSRMAYTDPMPSTFFIAYPDPHRMVIVKSSESLDVDVETVDDEEMPTTSGEKKQRPNFEVRKWNPVWGWDIVLSNCAICCNHNVDPCIECQAKQAASEECRVALGLCNHAFHFHCISPWIRIKHVCPMCNSEWEIACMATISNAGAL